MMVYGVNVIKRKLKEKFQSFAKMYRPYYSRRDSHVKGKGSGSKVKCGARRQAGPDVARLAGGTNWHLTEHPLTFSPLFPSLPPLLPPLRVLVRSSLSGSARLWAGWVVGDFPAIKDARMQSA